MDFEFNEKELNHKKIMNCLAVECRSNKVGFIEGKTQRIDKIRELLVGSGYNEILLPGVQLWRKSMDSNIDVVVSSHVDTVQFITKCSSSLNDNGYYHGTYDNAGTNSAAVIAMLEGNIPDNVMFAFTSDEETGRCNGAKQVFEYATNLGNDPIFIALDVTYEGFSNGKIFTIENISTGHKKHENMELLNSMAKSALDLDDDDTESFELIRIRRDVCPDSIPEKYITKTTGLYDEAMFYNQKKVPSFSLCMPCEGDMHGNSGVTVRQPSFEGYVNALESISHCLSKSENYESVLTQKKEENKALLGVLNDMVKEEAEIKMAEAKARAERLSSYKAMKGNPNLKWSYDGYSSSDDYNEDDYDSYMEYQMNDVEEFDWMDVMSWEEDNDYDVSEESLYDMWDRLAEVAFLYVEDYQDVFDRDDFIAHGLMMVPVLFTDAIGGEDALQYSLGSLYTNVEKESEKSEKESMLNILDDIINDADEMDEY